MENFNLEKHWCSFVSNKIVVNCPSEELAVEFLTYCHNQNMKWFSSDSLLYTKWDECGKNICYEYEDDSMTWAEIDFYRDLEKNKTIVVFKGFNPDKADVGKYKLVKREVLKEKVFRVIIKADSNDADYITTDETYTEEEFNDIIDDLINLKHNYSGRHELEDFPNESDLYIPSSEWGRCHTLEKLTVTCEDIDGIIYDVEF